MPEFRMSGMAAAPSIYRNRALVVLGAVIVAVVVIALVIVLTPKNTTAINMHTGVVPGGIKNGSVVVLNGAAVGKVVAVDAESASGRKVRLEIDKSKIDAGLLTNNMSVSYAPANLFGIASVVLQTESGGNRLGDNGNFYPEEPVDATMTTLLRKLSDMNDQAFKPHMSEILLNMNALTTGLVPVLGTVGTLLQAVTDTQRIPTKKTLPQFANLVASINNGLGPLLPALRKVFEFPGLNRPNIAGLFNDGVDQLFNLEDKLLPLTTALGLLMPAVPVLTPVLARIVDTFPNARGNGLQFAALLERIRKAMPDGPNGPVLNVDVLLRLGALAGSTGQGGR